MRLTSVLTILSFNLASIASLSASLAVLNNHYSVTENVFIIIGLNFSVSLVTSLLQFFSFVTSFSGLSNSLGVCAVFPATLVFCYMNTCLTSLVAILIRRHILSNISSIKPTSLPIKSIIFAILLVNLGATIFGGILTNIFKDVTYVEMCTNSSETLTPTNTRTRDQKSR